MKRLTLALVALLAVTGCAAPGPATDALALANTAWVVTAIKGSPTLSDKQPTISFQDARYAGTTGCNSYGGELTQNGSALKLGAAVVTAMACLDEAIMTQEAQFLAALTEVTSAHTTASGVDLTDPSGHSVMSLTRATSPSPRSLVGTTWTLAGIRSATTSTSAIADSTVTLTLAESRYTGKACNSFGGDLQVIGAKITFSAPHSTRMACPSPELTAQESAVLGTLVTITSWSITGSSLALSAPDGSGLDFVAS
jgi:heat shock protein HslJ